MYAAELNALNINQKATVLYDYQYGGQTKTKTVNGWITVVQHTKTGTFIEMAKTDKTMRGQTKMTVAFDTEVTING